MATLHVDNVPDELMNRIEELASRLNLSVSATVLKQLEESTCWLGNAAVLRDAPHEGVTPAQILAALDEGRASRG